MTTEKKEKSGLAGFFKKGEQYFVQTATHYYAGTLADVNDNALLLTDAAWVADTGRFNQFMGGAKPFELEPCGPAPVLISLGAVIAILPKKIIIEVL